MNIQEIYTKYYIMPSLQLHQYRVASVAKMICEHIKKPIDIHEVIAACLLHDMGNIIKFKLDLFPDFLEPEGMKYWQKVQQDYFDKYGKDEHEATMEISREIFDSSLWNKPPLSPLLTKEGSLRGGDTNSQRVLELIDAIGFSNAKYNYEHDDFSRKIAAYSDMRVEPHGVVSLQDRLADGHKRFKIHKPGRDDDTFFNEMASYLKQIEGQIFAETSLQPQEISEKAIQAYIPELKNYTLSS